jgi:hypothetical protein
MSGATKRFVVWRDPGPAWDRACNRREQDGWDEHAAFMDQLVDASFVELGGPVGDGARVLLICRAVDEDEVRRRLAEDPWPQDLLTITSVEAWDVLLDSARGGGTLAPSVIASNRGTRARPPA